jgi:hypothetical protein
MSKLGAAGHTFDVLQAGYEIHKYRKGKIGKRALAENLSIVGAGVVGGIFGGVIGGLAAGAAAGRLVDHLKKA